MLIGERNIVYTDSFSGVTNIRENVQNYYLEFEGLLHKMLSKKPFMTHEICYNNENCESELFIVSDYIK